MSADTLSSGGETPRAGWLKEALIGLDRAPALMGLSSAATITAKVLLHAFSSMEEPQVIPASDDGVCIEWHTEGCDAEIVIDANGRATLALDLSELRAALALARTGQAQAEAERDALKKHLALALELLKAAHSDAAD